MKTTVLILIQVIFTVTNVLFRDGPNVPFSEIFHRRGEMFLKFRKCNPVVPSLHSPHTGEWFAAAWRGKGMWP